MDMAVQGDPRLILENPFPDRMASDRLSCPQLIQKGPEGRGMGDQHLDILPAPSKQVFLN